MFNSENKPLPVAWVITPRFSSGDAYKWMRALYNRVLTKDPTWKLAGFIVDDPLADILAIRDVFECPVLLSLWRVRHAWHKNLIKRCAVNEMRIQMSKRLGEAVSEICMGERTVSLFDAFMEHFLDNSEFMEYFKAIWYPRIGSWITGLQTLPLASQETSAAIEFYHQQLNVRVLNEKDPSVYQRVDWLADKLATKVHSYFWLDEYPGKHDFSRYWKDEWVNASTSWWNSLKIPDSDVILEDQCAKVIDQQDRDKFHLIVNTGSMFSICDCILSERGYLCEHAFKVNRVCRKKGSCKPSLSLFQYKQALIKMLHFPPHDSLIRDHAVSLAAFLETQLNALTSLGSNENNLDTEQGDQNGTTADTDGRSLHQGVEETGLCSESALNEEMDIDPSSICVSPSGLFAIHGVLPADILSMNGDFHCMSGNETSKDNYNNQNGRELEISDLGCHKQLMDVEPQSLDIPFSLEPLDPCSVMSQHDYNSDKLVNSNTDNTDPKLDQTSQDVDPHPAKKQKITCVEDNGREDSERDDGKALESSGSPDVDDRTNFDSQYTEALTSPSKPVESHIISTSPGSSNLTGHQDNGIAGAGEMDKSPQPRECKC